MKGMEKGWLEAGLNHGQVSRFFGFCIESG